MSKVQYVWLSLVILTVAVEVITLRGLEEVPTTGEELRALEEVPTASNDDREEQDNDGGSFAKPALPGRCKVKSNMHHCKCRNCQLNGKTKISLAIPKVKLILVLLSLNLEHVYVVTS